MNDRHDPDQPDRNPNRPGPGGPLRPEGPGGPQNRVPRTMFTWLMLLSMGLLALLLFQGNRERTVKISFNDFLTQAKDNVFEEVTVRDTKITGRYRPDAKGYLKPDAPPNAPFEVEVSPSMVGFDLITYLYKESPTTKVTYVREFEWTGLIIQLLLWGGLLLFFYFVVFRQLRNVGGGGGFLGNFGRSKHRMMTKEATNVLFADVAGIDEAKDEVTEIVEFLKNPKKFQRLGGRIPRGVLLVGSPGCGKTMLAKAIAGEADVPFFSISGSDFVEMFVGVGASRVRDLFKQAKDNSPCIIFLDEIDAVGRKRGSGFSSGGHDEREQTLNAILVEMDGFDTNDQVIVIAATNRVDVLDPALTRPGRFDRQVFVPLPDVQGRFEILKVHARKVKCGSDVDLLRLARGTSGFSGADLAAIINEAAIIATMAEKDHVTQDDLEEARDKIRWGRTRKTKARDEKDNRMVAFHEAGHAVLQVLLADEDPLHKVSILPRGQAGGVTISLPEKDRITFPRKHALARLRTLFGGRICEELFCDDIGSGAQMDIAMATQLARTMVTEWGMSDRVGMIKLTPDENRPGFMDFGGGREYSEATAQVIDAEVKRLIDEAYQDARRMILDHKDFVFRLVEALLKYETLDNEDVQRIRNGETLSKPTIGDLLKNETRRLADAKPAPSADPGLPPLGGPLPQPG